MRRTPREAARLAAYLLRDLVRRIDRKRIGENRYRGLARELADNLLPHALAERSPLGWYRALTERFDATPTRGHASGYAAAAWLPEGRLRWDAAVAQIDHRHLRLVLHENAPLFASFATEPPLDPALETQLFDAFSWEDRPFVGVPFPKTCVPTRRLRTVWTSTAPMAHGADLKSGNVALFRRERRVNPLTGEHVLVPFVSGNAVRGLWRDLIFGRYLQGIGLTAADLPAKTRAHAMLAGGSLDQGADTATVNVAARRRARAACPPWDLFAGCVDAQIMAGCARVNDAVLVCRENAWLVHELVAPGVDLLTFANTLPEAAELTTLRLLTRHAHKEIPDADGSQMLVNTELVVAGAQWVHSLTTFKLDGVSELTLSCLADLLAAFAEDSYVGAGSARGYGSIAFDPYTTGDGASGLPSPEIYRAWLREHRDEARAWALGEPDPHAPPDAPAGEDRPKGGKGKAKGRGPTKTLQVEGGDGGAGV